MSRPPRIVVPGVPLHITQRGVDRCRTFHADHDYAFYRWALREAAVDADCALHAYALMTNHVHLLVTPADEGGAAQMMRSVGGRYVRYFNDRHHRTGTLWEGRFRSSLVKDAAYLFACSRYIEMNPVRAGLVSAPREYGWSSYEHNACGLRDPLLTEHPAYVALGESRASRAVAYQAMSTRDLTRKAIVAIRASQRGRSRIRPTARQQEVDAILADSARSTDDDESIEHVGWT
jgi:putative transposase